MSLAPRSLRARLTCALLLAFAALLGGTAWWVESTLAASVLADFDANLASRARTLAALVEQENGVIEFDYVARFQPEFERPELPDHFQIWLGDGQELMRSRWLTSELTVPSASAGPVFGDTVLAGGRSVRHVSLRFVPKSPAEEVGQAGTAGGAPVHEVVMAVARGREGLDATLAGMRRAILASSCLALVLGVVLIVGIVRLALRPVGAVAAEVRRLDAEVLDARIHAVHAPAELAPVVQQLNALLARLQEARERERRFAGNVAHELRTPVAELRSLASVALRWPDDVDAVRSFFGDVSAVAGRMDGIIGDLLLLARIQGDAERAQVAPVQLAPFVAEAVAHHRSRADGTPIRVEVAPDAVALTDRGKLAIVLDNLIANALAYRTPGTEVGCRGGVSRGRFWIEVHNRAEPLQAAELVRLSEPFWRRDEARSAPGHAGLGLSVVAAIARLLHLEVRFTQDREHRFTARVEGEAAAAPGPAPHAPAARVADPSSVPKPA